MLREFPVAPVTFGSRYIAESKHLFGQRGPLETVSAGECHRYGLIHSLSGIHVGITGCGKSIADKRLQIALNHREDNFAVIVNLEVHLTFSS